MKCSVMRCLSCLIVLKVGGKCCALVLSVIKVPSWSVIGLSWRMPNVSKVCWFERRKTLSSEFVVAVDLVAVVIGWCRLRMSMVLLKSIVCL